MQPRDSRKIKKTSAPDLVSEEIKSMILQNVWKVDEKIPSENDLAEIYGVNRFTVRMALQKLNTLGILQTRVGDGTYVREFDFGEHMKEIFEFYMSDELLDDVAEFRTVVETACLRLALEHADEEELQNLSSLCADFENKANEFLNTPLVSAKRKLVFLELNNLDIEIHSLLCRMSHNDLLYYSFTTAREAIREHMSTIGYRRLMALTSIDELQSLQDHWEIYKILRDKPANALEGLSDLITQHVHR